MMSHDPPLKSSPGHGGKHEAMTRRLPGPYYNFLKIDRADFNMAVLELGTNSYVWSRPTIHNWQATLENQQVHKLHNFLSHIIIETSLSTYFSN